MGSEIRERAYAWRLPLGITLAMVAALCIRVANAWPELPETMGSHFGLTGEPDAFTSKVGFFTFMAVVGGGTVALRFAMPRLLFRLPARFINLPNRDYWLASDARRVQALSRLSSVLAWMAMATAALLVLATELAVRANLYQRPFENGLFLVFLAVYFVVVIGATLSKLHSFHAVPLVFAVIVLAGCSGSDGVAGGGGGTAGGGGAESNCVDDGACRSGEGERCTCRDCWPRDACQFNACVDDGSCSLRENCACVDCAEAIECSAYCVPCSEFIRQFTFRGPFAPAYPPKDALCAPESAALYEALEQCACEESCADECDESLCAELPPSAACVTCYTGACSSELGACGLAVRPDILCNPVTGEPCRDGEACDYLQPVFGTISGFFCFPPPSDAVLCETCNTGIGPLCANTLTCADESGGLSSGNGSCARYCCTDGDCGAGTCVKGTYAPAAPDVGVCADDNGTVPACDLPSTPPSGGSCVEL